MLDDRATAASLPLPAFAGVGQGRLGCRLGDANALNPKVALFFLAFLSGVGPVYILRWLWWRVQASTEVVAMATEKMSAARTYDGFGIVICQS